MKKTSLILTAVSTMLLTSCIQTHPGSTTSSSKQTSSTTTSSHDVSTTSSKTPTSSQEKDIIDDIVRDGDGNIIYNNVELNLWTGTTGPDGETQDEIINEFNELYEGQIHVNASHQSRYDMNALLDTVLTYDVEHGPDILFYHSHWNNNYNYKEWTVPIEDYYEMTGLEFDISDFSETLLGACTINGKIFATPIDCHSATIMMRKDILEKNGLPIPTNYEELCSVCDQAVELASNGNLWIRGPEGSIEADTWRKATTEKPYTPFPFCYADMWVHEFAGYTAAIQNGAELVKHTSGDDDGYPAWNSDASANGLQVMRDFLFPSERSKNKKAFSIDYGTQTDVGDNPFLLGNAIFKFQGPWAIMSDETAFDNDFKTDGKNNFINRSLANFFATDPNNPNASKIKGEGHCLYEMKRNKSLTKRCAAAIFADFLAYNSGIKWAKRGHLPALSSVINDEGFKSDPYYDRYIKYWGMPSDYVTYSGTTYFSEVDDGFKIVLKKSVQTSTKDRSIREMLNEQYDMTVEDIEFNYDL